MSSEKQVEGEGFRQDVILVVLGRHRGTFAPLLHTQRLPIQYMIFVPQLVPEPVLGIESFLQFEEFSSTRIRAKKLPLRRVQLIGKVVRSAETQIGIHELPCPDTHRMTRLHVPSLLEVKDKREDLAACPGEQRSWIRFRVAIEMLITLTSACLRTLRISVANLSNCSTGTKYS